VAEGVHLVGGPEISDPRDCLCYLVEGRESRVLIDCGAGPSAEHILEMAHQAAGAPPTHLLVTHAHIDHCGGAAEVRRLAGARLLIHAGDAPVLAAGDARRSAADWYGMRLEPAEADELLSGGEVLELGGDRLEIVHTPGHTPGSLAVFRPRGRVLFGQDVHGPFSADFGSDIPAWRRSMARLLELEAEVLAEGHYGVFKPASEVESFIRRQLASV
jgi:glyoxylase-like metal-dependent hydrolase (beta-lactamase superfamily II)